MKFLEKDLEEIIYTSGRDVLDQRGLRITGKLKRQLKIGNYGIADLVEFQRPFYYDSIMHPGYITIYELKKEQVGIAGFLQSISYAKGILEYLRLRKLSKKYVINIVLIGKNVDMSGAFCFIEDMLLIENDFYNESVNIENGTISYYTYSFDINGLTFKHQSGYDLKNNGF